MPTFDTTAEFWRDYYALTPARRELFDRMVKKFVTDLSAGRFRKELRVKGFRGREGEYEVTWAPDGRATFRYGPPRREGDPHVIWLRCGTHDIFE